MALLCARGAKECSGCMKCREQEAAYECDCCGEEIYEDEEYYQVDDKRFCISCVERRIA